MTDQHRHEEMEMPGNAMGGNQEVQQEELAKTQKLSGNGAVGGDGCM